MASIRRAGANDIYGIAPLLEEVFEGVTIDRNYCKDLIAQEKQLVHIATEDEKVVGMVSGFVTHAGGGVKRWEVDLLAVSEAYRGKGIAEQLLEATWSEAAAQTVKFARGLVQVDNTAAQHAFQKAGYTSSGQVYDMLIWQPLASDAQFPSRGLVHAILVDTLTYRGLWLEGLDTQMLSDEDRHACLTGAQAQAAREGRDHTSALMPDDKPLSDDLSSTATNKGQYQWWRKP